MVSARAFSSLSFSECMAERLPCTRHTQVPLFPFIPTYPSYQKNHIMPKVFIVCQKLCSVQEQGVQEHRKATGVCVFLCCCGWISRMTFYGCRGAFADFAGS